MQRYFLENNEIVNNHIEISGNDFHHIKNVMRMNIGDMVYLCLNDETFKAQLESFQAQKVVFEIIEKIERTSEMPYDVAIAHGLVRREKKEEVIRRITELGARSYIPVNMERSIVKANGDEKLERQKTIIKEASEQSHRDRKMDLSTTISFKELIKLKDKYDLCLYAYEESGRSDNFNLKKYLKDFKVSNKKSIIVVVGPEGGFSPKEVKELDENGFKAVGLGPRILRTETAPLYVMSAISYELEIKD